VLPIVIAERLTPLVLTPLALPALLIMPLLITPLLIAPLLIAPSLAARLFSAPLLAPLIFELPVARTPGRLAIAVAYIIIVAFPRRPWSLRLMLAAACRSAADALARFLIPRALARGRVGVTVATAPGRSGRAARFALGMVVFGVRLLPIMRRGIGFARPPRLLVILIGRSNDGVEPLADRHAGPTRGVARCRARLRTETSQVPRTARSHSHVQAT
jgi:hypothetical protein